MKRCAAVLISVFVFMIAGCAKRVAYTPAPGAVPPGEAGAGIEQGKIIEDPRWRALGITTEEEKQEFLAAKEVFENRDIHFAFDSYELTEEAKRILEEKAEFLKRYPLVTVTIEGHCDERGTNEYNLALGERRAHSAWQYLVNLGIDPNRMTTISYGEEKPIALGHDEESWAKNRRAHFVLHY
ncbi:peptidoglycan-associated lipoprotein Pal [Thermodesulforhabdus norvegica]|uniref:Peptidoglycan-associated lipoprotein n=1 Tax=Thermodesulforhabdus norvegica TaxID=39841 RepID=A0A1I4TEG0_9BACT|nr:peptidoglycan-associated lipoprotein Pal [Thermodesulforhabdus norvegica]SFM75055.1 peptidoglycan-associated lipoprotein [Thermodesulforhabdus norvegica]